MTLAIILVIAAVLSLVYLSYAIFSRGRELSLGSNGVRQLQPVDIEAFRNLADPAEREYLRRRLPSSEFRAVQRARLRAMRAYVLVAAHNAAILIDIGQASLATGDVRTAEAAHQLVNNAVSLRKNATVAVLRITCDMVWPGADRAAAPILQGYERLSSSAMLLGRLQNPAAPVRIAANS